MKDENVFGLLYDERRSIVTGEDSLQREGEIIWEK